MTPSKTLSDPLAAFLAEPHIEASPAWEWLMNRALQKPMPSLFHSRLQRNLVNWLNAQGQGWEASQEFRCRVPPDSPVPDIAVVQRDRLPLEDGPLQGAPDWLIEIRSSGQSTPNFQAKDLQAKILHCLRQETQLAWLIDFEREQVWVWQGAELLNVYGADDVLPVLDGFFSLTVRNVMAMTGRFIDEE
ncbi:MAG: Uma2 family endonuclease [Spirulinaceae cyanobacterium]